MLHHLPNGLGLLPHIAVLGTAEGGDTLAKVARDQSVEKAVSPFPLRQKQKAIGILSKT